MPKTPKKTGYISRRLFSALLPSLLLPMTVPLLLPTFAQSQTHDIVVEYVRNDLHQIEARLEYKGIIQVMSDLDNDGERQAPEQLALEVTADIPYLQRFSGDAENLQAIRKYTGATADFRIDRRTKAVELANDDSLILARIKPDSGQRLQLACITDHLTQSELDLIRNPCDALSFPALLSKPDAPIGEAWSPTNESLADFLAIDRVYQNDAQLALKSVENGIAKIHLTGSVKGEVDDVRTEIEISAAVLVDIAANHVTSIQTTIREQRETGQIAAGFDGEIKIELHMNRQTSIDELSNETLSAVAAKQVDRNLKWESNRGRFAVVYDTRWRMIVAEDDAAIMRFVENGNLLAQCNIVQLPSRPAGRPLSLDLFKDEVTKMIGKDDSAKVVNAEAKRTANDLSALRITVEGIEGEVPVQWIYYHLEAEDGRRMTFVFTMEQEIAAEFVPADKLLVNQLVFREKLTKAADSDAQPARTGNQQNSSSTRSNR